MPAGSGELASTTGGLRRGFAFVPSLGMTTRAPILVSHTVPGIVVLAMHVLVIYIYNTYYTIIHVHIEI